MNDENLKDINADLKAQHAAGAKIQFLNCDGEWRNVKDNTPKWEDNTEYRVAVQFVTVYPNLEPSSYSTYENALMGIEGYVGSAIVKVTFTSPPTSEVVYTVK